MITAKQITSWGPCEDYPPARVRDLVGDGLDLPGILALDIPGEDRLWVACEYLARHDRHVLESWIGDVVEHAVRLHCLGCGVAAVESWARLWLDGDGEAHTEAAAWAARAAARDAAWAARAAARDAAWAARAAARDAAWAARAAARATAGATARAAAWATARATETDWQIRCLLWHLDAGPAPD